MTAIKKSNTQWMVSTIVLTTLLGCLGVPIVSSILENSWSRVSSLPQEAVKVEIAPVADCGTYRFTLPSMPKGVVASYQDCKFYGDGASFSAYILLSDGSVRMWHTQRVMLEGLARPVAFVMQMVLGALAGVIVACLIVPAMVASQWVKKIVAAKRNTNPV